ITLNCISDRRLPRAMLDRTPDADNYPTSIGQHSMHFGNRCGFVRNELQAMLANDTVESRISKRHVCSVAQPPFDRGGCFTRSACSREHARVEIEADNLDGRAAARVAGGAGLAVLPLE